MARFSVLRWLVGDEKETLYECRNCGQSLDEEFAACPECGSDSIGQYRL